MTDASSRSPLVEFVPVLLVNLAPLAGLAWLGWELATLYAFYWVDVVAMTLVYAGCAMFAQRKIVTDNRRLTLPGVSENEDYDEKWSDDPRAVTVHSALPPLYPRNAGVVFASLVWALFVAGIVGYGLAADFLANGESPPELRSPLLLASLVGVVVSHVHHAYRTFFRPRRYEEMSAHMVLEIPLRVIVYLFVAVMAWLFGTALTAGLLIAAEARPLAEVAFLALLFGGWFAIKISVEWGRFQAERAEDPAWFASWFVPEDPRPDWIVESEQS